MPTAIELRSLSKIFAPSLLTLENLDLQISAGEFVSVMGPSGCGKSTLLRLIAGLEIPSRGSVNVAEACQSFGFVFQEAHLLPWRNLEQNIALPLQFQGASPKEIHSRISAMLELIGLTEFRQAYPSQLSGGMKMRASLARALITRPKILLLDEPFAALEESLRYRLDRELRSLWKQLDLTVIFVTHSVSEAVFVSNRLITLSKRPGRIVGDEVIDLPQDRSAEMKWTESFLHRVAKIANQLESTEVRS